MLHFFFSFFFVVVDAVVVLGGYSITDSLDKKADDSLKIKVNIWFKLPCSTCEQWFLQVGHYAAKGEKLLLATVCFSIKHARPRDAYVNTSNDFISSCFAGNIRDFNPACKTGVKTENFWYRGSVTKVVPVLPHREETESSSQWNLLSLDRFGVWCSSRFIAWPNIVFIVCK